jgi:plastocyanin
MIRTRFSSALALACIAGLVGMGALLRAQQREVSVTGNDFRYSPDRIEVQNGDLVKITFTASDMAHSFTIDNYRIAKRAGAGQSVTFEFRADQPGEHTYYCNLSQDDRCRTMKGTLVVR